MIGKQREGNSALSGQILMVAWIGFFIKYSVEKNIMNVNVFILHLTDIDWTSTFCLAGCIAVAGFGLKRTSRSLLPHFLLQRRVSLSKTQFWSVTLGKEKEEFGAENQLLISFGYLCIWRFLFQIWGIYNTLSFIFSQTLSLSHLILFFFFHPIDSLGAEIKGCLLLKRKLHPEGPGRNQSVALCRKRSFVGGQARSCFLDWG